jgi:hypothetical protein
MVESGKLKWRDEEGSRQNTLPTFKGKRVPYENDEKEVDMERDATAPPIDGSTARAKHRRRHRSSVYSKVLPC